MSLLVFNYLVSGFLFWFAYYLDSHEGKNNSVFTSITLNSAFITLASAFSATMFLAGFRPIGNIVLFVVLALTCVLSLSLLRYSFWIPYMAKNRGIDVLSVLLGVFGAYVLIRGKIHLDWDGSSLINLTSASVFTGVSGLYAFASVFLVGIPFLSAFILFMRAISLKSRIYRQRLLLVAASLCAGFAVFYFLYRLALVYPELLVFLPFGLPVIIALVHRTSSLSTLLDRTTLTSNVVSFLALGVAFSAFAGFSVALVYSLKLPDIAFAAILVALLAILLEIRYHTAARITRRFRLGTEYEQALETELDSIDYSTGGADVIARTVSLFENYVEATAVTILVSDDKGKLVSVHAGTDARLEIPVANKAIDMMLGGNVSIVLKTQAITKHYYTEVKDDLLKILDAGRADAMILLREGHRVTGLILLGPKKRGADYSDYDFTVLSRLYTKFFVVLYYLKNIANESVVLTVDREIEYSGQIITSIQDNIDRIHHEKADVDFVTKSARKLGGDFIDFIKITDEKYLFVMGDVSGKGLNASMSMVILKSVLRTFLTETGDFKKLIVKVNLFIKNNLPKGTFFAGMFGLMDFGTNVLYYINCGVPAMFLYTATYNNAIEIQGDGKILGFARDIAKFLKVKKIVLNPQDIILITTDGLLDSTNIRGERFGKDRVQRLLMDNRSYPAARMAQFLCDNLSEFVSREFEDDISVLVFKYLGKQG
jgi:serine phosphatase RsbU (regulator of sigma subunit)